jgi:hypothetical protein
MIQMNFNIIPGEHLAEPVRDLLQTLAEHSTSQEIAYIGEMNGGRARTYQVLDTSVTRSGFDLTIVGQSERNINDATRYLEVALRSKLVEATK